MATLTERLQEVMAACNWEHADVVRISQQSSSVVSQWLGKTSKEIKTIGKMEAAIYLERASGFSALWIAKGMGPKRVASAIGGARMVGEPPAPWPAITSRDVLDRMGDILRELPPDLRDAVADNLAGWARDGGAIHWRRALGALLGLRE